MRRIFTTILMIGLTGLLTLTAQERVFIPELSLPVNGAVDQMPDVILDWNAVTGGNTGIIEYQIQLDTDPGFPNPVNFETEFLSAIQTSQLLFGETYYWRVRAIDGNDVSGWSETWSFRVIRRVVLSRPTDASSQTTEVKLEWIAITGITEYDYQIDTVYYWSRFPSGQTGNLFAISVLDETHAWIVGAGGLVLFYDGFSMTPQTSGTTNDLMGVAFIDENNGWAVGKSGQINYYDGSEWSAQSSGLTTDLLAVSFLDANNGWAVGNSGKILYFDGTEWTTQFTATKNLFAIHAYDANHVWAVGQGGLIMFYNGTTWTIQESGTARDLLGVSFGTVDNGFISGKSGTIIQYSGGIWKTYEHSLSTRDLTGICFVAPDNAWIVGKSGATLNYDGIEWFNQTGGTATDLNATGFLNGTGFLVGNNGVVARYSDEAFNSPLAVIHHVAGTQLSANLTDLNFGTQYFWRMRAKHSQDVSEWSGARSFITASTVELDKPNDNSMNQQLDVQLKWKKLATLVTYEIEIDDDPNFGSPVYLATSNIQINARLLKFGLQYFWRVRALHPFDTSNWSGPWKFTTVNSVTLKTPANNETEVKLSPLLTWELMTGITGYEVYFSTSNNFDELIFSAITPQEENQYAVPLVLDRGVQYYWKARAINGLDTSGWSPVWSFTTLQPIGIDEPGLEGKLSIYPNPAENTVYIQLKSKDGLNAQLTLSDLLGKTVISRDFQLTPGNKSISLDVSTLRNGLYMLRLSDQEEVFTRKLIIKR